MNVKNKIGVKSIILIFLAVTMACATKIVAILEIVPADEAVDLKISEYRHLTDELRTQAFEALSQPGFAILTRDNIISLMPSDADEAACFSEQCAVEIGRAIGAEYVTQGFIGRFSGMFTLNVELYESMSGNLLGSFVTESNNMMGLLRAVRKKSPGLFANINPKSEEKSTQPQPHVALSVISEPVPMPQQAKKTSTIVAVALDFLGAAMLGFGIYQHINANSLNDEYVNMPQNLPQEQYVRALRKANDALERRNIGYAVGGALLAAGVAVHIWF
ncbi:MAG: hypothetical protein FWC26_15235 [Fibromonadales bacterium]|nr:hypothetical protein [Fibromonadales bacterium]